VRFVRGRNKLNFIGGKQGQDSRVSLSTMVSSHVQFPDLSMGHRR
jgi:hypothetical protein